MVIIMLFAAGWSWTIIQTSMALRQGKTLLPNPDVAPVSRAVSSGILDPRSTSIAFLEEYALQFADPLRGDSGALSAAIVAPGDPLSVDTKDAKIVYRDTAGRQVYVAQGTEAPSQPGIYGLSLGLGSLSRPVSDFGLITLVPFNQKRQGRIGNYMLGSWPYERGGTPRSSRYADPRGFIEVTPENKDFHVSEHFQLKDFLTKDQGNVWPKYLLLDPLLLDKLELTIQELERMGVKVEHMQVMSGFRTPRYNESGGNTAGRANLSRHVYGDAADIFVDNDRDGWTDDITGDGRVTIEDAKRIAEAGERVEKRYPHLVGGIGIYKTCCGHGPFTHLDVRGYRARW